MKVAVGFAIILLVCIGSYVYFTRVAHTPIGNILKEPRKYEKKTLTISGQVTDRASLLVVRYFRVKDNTGEIPVVTRRTLPSVGSKVRVKGRVEEAFSIGAEQLLVFVEEAKDEGEGTGQ
jgi:hypothetical protein